YAVVICSSKGDRQGRRASTWHIRWLSITRPMSRPCWTASTSGCLPTDRTATRSRFKKKDTTSEGSGWARTGTRELTLATVQAMPASVYPGQCATSVVEIWRSAHARVPLRRIPPAVEDGDDLDTVAADAVEEGEEARSLPQ